jgi:hypothetical protein
MRTVVRSSFRMTATQGDGAEACAPRLALREKVDIHGKFVVYAHGHSSNDIAMLLWANNDVGDTGVAGR